MPKVYSRRRGAETPPPSAVYIGRGTPWGNPIYLNNPNSLTDRWKVLARYATYLAKNPELVARARRELRGRDLVCWCAPKPCHGDILLEIANED